jgi:hypothetical protein
MNASTVSSRHRFLPWLHSFQRRENATRKPAARLEPLEARIAPATFAGTGGPSLDISLNQNGEIITIVSNGATYTITSNSTAVDGGQTGGHVSGFGTSTAVIDAAAFTTININDNAIATFVEFGASGANVYTSAFNILLDSPMAAGMTFSGASTFHAPLTASVKLGITQTAPITSTSTVSLTSTAGAITLDDAANNFSVVSLETSGANAISLRTSGTLVLDRVTTDTGNLSITAGAGIGQTSTGRIDVGGTATFDFTSGANIPLGLDGADNFFGGPVIVTESGGDIADIFLRNVSPTAALPNLSDLASGDLNNLTLIFDGTGIALDAATEDKLGPAGSLVLTAGGPITQTAAITVFSLRATVLGNHGITLTNLGNVVNNDVILNNPDADGGAASAVAYVENGPIVFNASNLGLGTLSITALTGGITQMGSITQQLGAGAATFTATTGTSINLGNQANTFAGAVHFVGAALTDIQLRDTNTLAALPDLTDVIDTLTDLSLTFNNAPVVLPNYTALANLTVAADGIYQQPGTHLAVSGTADFNATAFKIDLSNPANDFSTLRLRSTGREDVGVVDVDDFAFGGGNSDVGTGRLTVTAGGAITQSANRIKQLAGAGPATFTAPSLILDRTQNDFTGEVVVKTSGAATLVDLNSIVLGKIATGGSLTVTATNNITQLAGSAISVAGTSLFDSGGGANVITLDNPGNTFSGVQFADGNVKVRSAGALVFTGANSVASLQATTTGGDIGEAVGATLVVSGTTMLDAGANSINVDQTGNNFQGAVSLASKATVTLRDLNTIQLGNVTLGSGAFTVNATGNITQVTGTAITQTGTGALGFFGGAANNVTLSENGNDLFGPISVDASAVTLKSLGDVIFAAGADIDGNLVAVAGGTIRLPSVAANLNDLGNTTLAAARIIVSTDLATDTGTGIAFHGAVELASGITITTSANNGVVTFDGDVTALGALTFNPGAGPVTLTSGTWTQGANNLTITSTGDSALHIGSISLRPATFVMSGGTLDLNVAAGGNALLVTSSGTFRVGAAAGSPEIATVDTGAVATTVHFDAGSNLQVGFGAANDRLVVNGVGGVVLAGTRLIGSGAAGGTASPVLAVTGGGVLVGTFNDSVALDGSAQAFFAGSDIVTADYLPTSASIQFGGPVPAGSFSGFLPDGDKYTVTHTGGVAAGLVVVQNDHGQIDIAVRNNAAAGTLNIVTTKFSGDGLTEIGGIGINGAGAITINAATSNLRGDLRVEDALTALTIRDVLNDTTAAGPQLIHAGGAATASTSITGHQFDGVGIELGSVLNTLKVASFISTHPDAEPARVTAERFGTVSAVGDAGANLIADFEARLTNKNSLNSAVALASFTSAKLSGTWDLAGSVGSVTVTQSIANWTLGASGPDTVHFHGVTAAGNLSFAGADTSAIVVTGAVAAFKATNVFNVSLTAGSLGSFSTVVDPSGRANGNVTGLILTLTGNQAGMALKSLSVAGTIQNSTLHFLNGNVGTFTVGRELSNSFVTADATTAGGRFNAMTIGRWNNSDLDAKSVGTLKVIGHAVAGLFGDIVDSNLTIRDQVAGLGLGTLAASGLIGTSNFIVRSGGVTSFSAARGIADSNITLFDAALGNVKTVTAAFWNNTDLTARTIGTLKATGAALVAPGSPLLVGDLNNSAILAFADSGTTPAIGTLAVAGGLNTSSVIARNGITTLTVARSLISSTVVADNVLAGQLAVGRIGTLTLGSASADQIVATTLGKISTTGFVVQNGALASFTVGGWSGGTLLANGASPSGTKTGIDSLSIAGPLQTLPTVTARGGIGSLTVRGSLANATLTFDDPLNLSGSGKVGKVSAGKWQDSTIRANVLTTLQTVPSALDGVFGDFSNPTVTFAEVTVAGSSGVATDPVALTTFTVAGDLSDTAFNIPGGVKTFKVAGIVSDSDLAAGFATNARIASLTAGAWDNTDVTTRVLSAMNVTGNSARAIAGNITDSLLTIMGNNTGIGLGTFVAQGTVSNTTFQVTDGNVTSFIAGRFFDSNLYVGFRPNSTIDLTQGGLFGPTDRTIGLFKTTQPFDPTDLDSVSFRNSNIVAAELGAITLTGVDPAADRPILFGIGFETGGTAGVVKVNLGAGLVTLTAPFPSGEFTYRGL